MFKVCQFYHFDFMQQKFTFLIYEHVLYTTGQKFHWTEEFEKWEQEF